MAQLASEVRFVAHSDVPPAGTLHQLLARAMPLLQSPLAVRRLLKRGMPEADIIFSLELMGVGVHHPRHLHLFFGSYAGFRAQALHRRAGWRGMLMRRVVDLIALALERRTQGTQGSLANSLGLRDCLKAHHIPTREEVIPPPTDTQWFRPGDKAAARIELGLPQAKRLVLFAGRWEFAKGADRMTAIASLLPPDCHVVIAAPADASWPWPAASNITRLRDVSNMQMATVYQAVDVLVQPSRFEGYSLVASEAQACGCPVLTSNVGHATHFSQSAVPFISGSVIMDADNPLAWIDKIQEILPPIALAQASAASREYAEAHVSLQVIQLCWSHLLSSLYPEYEWHPH
ncbi:glycosyltransferase family 4 protein [Aquabacterium sp.]|uniref:glycosyltransferase family 4 protein n=1 Tax=Aquabacterium sp. TaxID=1872578 RepID=UPI003CFE7AB3